MLGLVVTAGLVAGVTAVAVAKAPAARATSGPAVAVVLVNGESSAPESAVLTAAGYSVTQVSTATLAAMSKSTFQGYAAVVIGDGTFDDVARHHLGRLGDGERGRAGHGPGDAGHIRG